MTGGAPSGAWRAQMLKHKFRLRKVWPKLNSNAPNLEADELDVDESASNGTETLKDDRYVVGALC